MTTLIYTPTWRIAGGQVAMRRETERSVERLRGEWSWQVGTDNPYGARDHRNVLHQYRQAWELALGGGYDALLTVEHDMWLPDDGALERLRATSAEVVFGVYMLRHGASVLNAWRYEGDRNLGESLTLHGRELRQARRQAATRVSGTGWGCTLIRRAVLERIQPHDDGGANPAGDLAFARDCLRANIPMYARWDVGCGHYAPERGRWLWPDEARNLVEVIGVAPAVMRGRVRLRPGEPALLPPDVADDAVRAGFASYAPPSACADNGGRDASAVVETVQPSPRAAAGGGNRGRGGRRGGAGPDPAGGGGAAETGAA